MCAWRQTARGGDPSTPSATLAARHLRVGLAPAGTNSEGWRPQDPKRPKGPPLLGLAPLLAHWASLPLFCFRPPSPCPRAAAMPYGAEARLLRCCWCLLVNVDTLAYTVPRATGAWPSLAITGPSACHVPCLLVCSHDRPAELLLLAAAPGSSLVWGPALGQLPLWAICCDRNAPSQHVLVRTPSPNAILCQFHTCWRVASR